MSDSNDALEKPKRTESSITNTTTDTSPRTVGGLLFIGLGIFFLLQQFGAFLMTSNWWAILLLVPAGIMLSRIYSMYQQEGKVPDEMRMQAIGGVALLILGFMFLFNIEWGKVWPLVLIGLGIWILTNKDQSEDNHSSSSS